MINVNVIYIFIYITVRIYYINPLVGICIGCEYAYTRSGGGVLIVKCVLLRYTRSGGRVLKLKGGVLFRYCRSGGEVGVMYQTQPYRT